MCAVIEKYWNQEKAKENYKLGEYMLEIDKRKKYRSDSLLGTDFSSCAYELENWQKQNERKAKIYQALKEYMEYLENSLKNESDPFNRVSLQKQIKKLKKTMKEYYVPSVLETDFSSEDTLEKSVKQKKKRFKN